MMNNLLTKKGGITLRKLNSLVLKFGMTFASLALIITSMNANRVCMYIAHQPELPEGAKKLRKF